MGDEENVLHLPVRVTPSEGNDSDLEMINRLTLEPLTLEEVFTFSGLCSNDRMDAYFTRMDPLTTLRNYSEDLKAGVSLQEGHNIWENPYGRSYDGQLVPVDNGAEQFNSVRGHWYLVRGLTINGSNTDDTIRAIKGGIIRDMSVGFGGTEMWFKCGTCGRDLFDRDCPHIPGLEDGDGNLSFAWVMDAHLREVSTVYKGATPGAFIDKARQYVGQGELEENKIQRLEQRYQVRFERGSTAIFMPKKEEGRMDLLEQLRQAIGENKIEKARVYEVLQAEGDAFRQPDDVALRNELGDAATVEGVKQLKTEAEQGRQYVADMIDRAVQARVKAQGDSFKEESYRQMLVRSADLDYIKEEIEAYEQQAGGRFTSGRQTKEDLGGQGNERREKPKFNPDETNIFEEE